jgi:phage shock protein A
MRTRTQQQLTAASSRSRQFEELATRRVEEIAQSEPRCERLERELHTAQRERDAAEGELRALIGALSFSGQQQVPVVSLAF